MTDQNPVSKPLFKRWWFWVLVVFLLIIIGIGSTLYVRYIVMMRMDSNEVKKAETALASGFTLNDPKADFVIMGSNKEELSTDTNNENPYKIEYSDIKSTQIGADEKYIYVKISFYEQIPKWPETIDGDTVQNVGNKLHIMNQGGLDQIVFHFDFGWEPVIKIAALNTMYDFCPTGIEWPEEARMSCHGDDSKIYGGPGTDYVLAALPMKKIGLKLGETIYMSVAEETKSNKYSHASVDMLQGVGKMPGFITWNIGSSDYKIDNTEKYQSGY